MTSWAISICWFISLEFNNYLLCLLITMLKRQGDSHRILMGIFNNNLFYFSLSISDSFTLCMHMCIFVCFCVCVSLGHHSSGWPLRISHWPRIYQNDETGCTVSHCPICICLPVLEFQWALPHLTLLHIFWGSNSSLHSYLASTVLTTIAAA